MDYLKVVKDLISTDTAAPPVLNYGKVSLGEPISVSWSKNVDTSTQKSLFFTVEDGHTDAGTLR